MIDSTWINCSALNGHSDHTLGFHAKVSLRLDHYTSHGLFLDERKDHE